MNVLPGEKITRFIRRNRDFSEPNIVRKEVFLPHRKKVDISVFRISELTESEVWKIGWEHVQTAKSPVLARADLFASNVNENKLEVIPDTQSHKLHANITGFPVEREENKTEDRRLRQAIARKLALSSKLEIPPQQS
ncbi:MAG: hypothetical protein OXU23_26820 [Candidatus Poribacteria bacterium]|nr:hypothetical protein [Candidatus Poribacteria bacterium]